MFRAPLELVDKIFELQEEHDASNAFVKMLIMYSPVWLSYI